VLIVSAQARMNPVRAIPPTPLARSEILSLAEEKIMASTCVGNRLLAVLPSSDQNRFFATCEEVGLVRAEPLHAAGDLEYVYFPTCGSISLVLPVGKSASLEVGLVGNEGMFGVPLTRDVPACPFHAVVQAPGAALRMGAADFHRELGRSAALRERLDRYFCVRFTRAGLPVPAFMM
jgi:hypothetical protein